MAGGGPGVRRRKVTTGNPSTPPEPPRADPVLPVAVYEDIEEVYAYLGETYSGQQSAIFTSKEAEVRPTEELSKLLDVCDWSICRVNINMQGLVKRVREALEMKKTFRSGHFLDKSVEAFPKDEWWPAAPLRAYRFTSAERVF